MQVPEWADGPLPDVPESDEEPERAPRHARPAGSLIGTAMTRIRGLTSTVSNTVSAALAGPAEGGYLPAGAAQARMPASGRTAGA